MGPSCAMYSLGFTKKHCGKPLMALKQESKKQSVFLKIKVYPDCCVEDRVAKRDH